ncbi:comEA protein [Afipia felis]|jgi:DNA uptake protein ComE-like DNA-binding protein|uniref:ComEA protein n=1 Tax=Afipia felis TaxID=1035 RepID=A0A090MV59_AFIFE|nr:helix-hairpin-helix domain-containing protein [Afipia felis]MBE0702713.1 helix-hairpin-helix domain-containing protein [Afipia sp.]CEG09779.1 comEA protein [Afipia felis]
MRYFKPVSLTAALLALGLLATPSFAQSTQPAPGTTMAPKTAPVSTPKSDKMAPKAAAQKELIDINSASADELKSLKGIGDAYSAAIIKNRPYKGKDDLVHKKVIPEKTYAAIKGQIIAKQK